MIKVNIVINKLINAKSLLKLGNTTTIKYIKIKYSQSFAFIHINAPFCQNYNNHI